jgi:hypothetical protein
MCLITTQKIALIANEDITVFKVLTENESAVYQLFTYEIGKVYTEKIEHSDEWCCLGILDVEWLQSNYPNGWKREPDLICLGQGFHSIDNLESAKKVLVEGNEIHKIYECTIPKGSEYYKDAVGFMISSSLVINNQLKFSLKYNDETFYFEVVEDVNEEVS